MKRISTLLISALCTIGAVAQQPTALIKKASVAPVIDGVIEELWSEAEKNNIDKPFQTDVFTLGAVGETTWQGLWTDEGMYILLIVNDDEFYPHYAPEPDGDHWEYDKPEIYFDVNYTLADGLGCAPDGSGGGNGHYQAAPQFEDGMNDGTPITESNGVVHAFMVNDPDYVGEYFVPFSWLVAGDGSPVDLSGDIGFDVTIIDRDMADAGRARAVWANIGTFGESWSNMDEIGIINFDGADAPTYIESITLTADAITENNGSVQVMAAIVPEDASNKVLSWTIEHGTGKATIDSDGMVKGIVDGTATVTAAGQDGSYVETSLEITISNQIVSVGELNIFMNPYFDLVEENGEATGWGGWAEHGDPMPQVVDGEAIMTPTLKPDGDPFVWHYQYNQVNFTALPDVEYEFSFVARADEAAALPVDFEDTEANGHNRYGSTSDSRSADGRSEWIVDLTTESQKFSLDVTFDEMVETTVQKVLFMPGLLETYIYLDSILLISTEDLALVDDYVPVQTITVSGEGDASEVGLGETLQMSAGILPAEADYQDVKWSVSSGDGWASIDEMGLLTGDSSGIVTVIANAVDDSYVSGELEVTVGVVEGVEDYSAKQMKVYPNPALNELYVELTEGNATIAIYNSVGMKMDEVLVTGTLHKFDISSYAAGLYFVKTDDSVMKFIK